MIWEHWFGFHALFGFVSIIVLVLLARLLRKVVGRDEDHYER